MKDEETAGMKSRDAVIVRTSIIGITANVFLAAFKAFVGMASNSIAIVMDAVNNLSDAASSVITIVGTKLAGKEPDRKHPFGYGRIEYLSAMVISLLVLYAGVTAFIESVKKIISPETPDYSAAALIIVAVAVVVKIVLGRYVKSVGKKVNSDSLVNSGEDATLDSIISASTLVAAVVYLFFHISLEAWLGAVIAVVIIKSGVEMLKETISQILGERADVKLVREIKETVTDYPQISGAYDLVLHNYGPDSFNGSVHVEVPDTLSAEELDKLLRKVTADVYQKHNVLLTAIGVYSVNSKDADVVSVRENVLSIVRTNPYVLQMHGFNLDKEDKTIRFDIVVSFDAGNRRQVYCEVCDKVQREYPDYTLQVAMDADFSG
ncbi:MAG: cation diffusion facilitator family transporter [Lachnospiraceae bacterium]|nr:cation diffusion facilitator family transporter [Lachnospiraceae bacterium]